MAEAQAGQRVVFFVDAAHFVFAPFWGLVLLRLLAGTHPGVPLTLVLDNACYQRCKLLQHLAQSLGIELLFLPPYSPNLNLIERFWKFVKKQSLYSKHYPDHHAFQQAILDCIAQAPTQDRSSRVKYISRVSE